MVWGVKKGCRDMGRSGRDVCNALADQGQETHVTVCSLGELHRFGTSILSLPSNNNSVNIRQNPPNTPYMCGASPLSDNFLHV